MMFIQKFKSLLFSATAVLAVLWAAPSLADTFSVSLPASTEVVMQNPDTVLPFTVVNNGPTRDIRGITFTIDTAKYAFSSATTAPDGWCVSSVSSGSISFALKFALGLCLSVNNGSEIGPSESVTFNITLLPAAKAADVTGESLTGVNVTSQGGFALSGSLPTWTLRSLEATLEATPSSVGAGDEITLTMQVTNRSSGAQTSINSTPSPPTPSSAIVTNTGGPYWASTLLSGSHNATVTTITVDSTAEFPSAGTIRVESEDICYTGKTATTFTGGTRGCNATTAATHADNATVYSRTAFDLSSGGSGAVIWKYSADSTGSVYFTARGTGSGGTATSPSLVSNTVVIGDFTAAISVSPTSIVDGQDVTVEMTVANNGSASLVNVAPTALAGCAGGATETLSSGPSPASLSTLAAGSSTVFTWTYTITGTEGQPYCLSGGATADGPSSTNTAVSNTGTVSVYTVTVTPSAVSSGSTNQALTWTVYNGSGYTIRRVTINPPTSGADWNCGSVTAVAGWTTAGCADPVVFSSNSSANDIPSGGTGNFTITFSSTETVSADKSASFPVTLLPRTFLPFISDTVGTYVTVTAYGLALTHSPAGPVYADGSSIYTMTATLTSGGSPVSGKTITFTTTSGTLDPSSAVTDSNGQAAVALVSPVSTTNTTATVIASYLSAEDADTVSFNGWSGPNIQYWGGMSPVSVNCGTSYSFSVNVRNLSATTAMALTTSSYFAFNDSSLGGTAVYKAYLNSGVTVPALSGTVELTFGSPTASGGGGGVSVSSGFVAGTYSPTANSSPPPESGMYFTDGVTASYDQYRSVTDDVTVGGDCGAVNVNVIEWHEMR
jgi:hypothetical protein